MAEAFSLGLMLARKELWLEVRLRNVYFKSCFVLISVEFTSTSLCILHYFGKLLYLNYLINVVNQKVWVAF